MGILFVKKRKTNFWKKSLNKNFSFGPNLHQAKYVIISFLAVRVGVGGGGVKKSKLPRMT